VPPFYSSLSLGIDLKAMKIAPSAGLAARV
jgi:hypothetical protein